jgi:hypothetical protein
MKKNITSTWALIALFVLPLSSYAKQKTPEWCSLIECGAGSNVITQADKENFYYACPTMEIGSYVTYVFGVTTMIYGVTGKLPNISPQTGEPEQEGQSKKIIEGLRNRAKVTTFDQALSTCKKGKNGIALVVANNPKAEIVEWVFNRKTHESYWVPKSSIALMPR